MLLIEFQTNLSSGFNVLKYRNVDDDNWYYLHIDVETLHLLLQQYGVISTHKIPTKHTNCDNPTTSKTIKLKYCGAEIQMYCGNNAAFNILSIEQNY